VAGFEPVQLLGRGGFADVFLYRQSTPRRQVALKVLHTSDLGDKAIGKLALEADTMAELSTHPHIATIHTSGLTDDGRPYLAMEYCPKPSLNIGLRTVRRTVGEVLGIGVEIAGAVETAHRSGVLHRDIKPANILVTQYDNPVLTDFGIAVSVRQSTDQVEGLSVPWSPPEAFTQPPTAGPSSDVWGLAATVYSLLAGRAPFEVVGGDNTASVQMGRIQSEVLPPVGRADCPPSLDRVLAVGMAKDPERRFATALAFGTALQRVQAELGIDPTRMVIQSDNQDTPPVVAEVGDDPDDTLTRLRHPRLIDQPEPTRPVEPTVFDGQTGPTRKAAGQVEPDALAEPVEQAELDEPGGPGEQVGATDSTPQVKPTGPTRKTEPGEQSKPPRTAGSGHKTEPAKQVNPPRTAGPGQPAEQVAQFGAARPTEPGRLVDPSGLGNDTRLAVSTAPTRPAVGSTFPDETLLAPTRAVPIYNRPPENRPLTTQPGVWEPRPETQASSTPGRRLRRTLVAVAVAVVAIAGGAFLAYLFSGDPEPVVAATPGHTRDAAPPVEPTPTRTATPGSAQVPLLAPSPSPKSKSGSMPTPSPTEPTLVEGTCLSVSPGELKTDPPKDWKTMQVGCATRRAAVRLVNPDNCTDDSGCAGLPGGTNPPLMFVPLPAEGVCFPAYEIGNTGVGTGWVKEWSPCDDFRRPPFVDSDATKERIAGEHGVSVGDLQPSKWKIDRLTVGASSCGQYYFDNVVFDGQTYVACATMQ